MQRAFYSNVIGATLPFITLGLLGNRIVLYISVSIGCLALVMLVSALLLKSRSDFGKSLISLFQGLFLPYAIALSALILYDKGYDVSVVLWISLLLAILIIGSNIIRLRRS